MTRLHPSGANARAMARPMPRLAPVMSATFPRRWERAKRRFAGTLATVSVINQGQEFGSSLLLIAEAAQHGRCDCGGVLLLYASHHHAEMTGFDNHPHALGLNGFLNGFCDLRGQALLNLEAARKILMRRRILLRPITFPVGM